MINQQLLDYIKQQLQQGISQEEIKKNLLRIGWHESDIEEGFNSVGVFKVEERIALKPIKKSKNWSIVLIILIFLIMIGGVVLYLLKILRIQNLFQFLKQQ